MALTDITQRHAVMLALMLVMSGAGAAAGTTLSGSLSGQASTTVEQSVIVPADRFSAAAVDSENTVVSVNEGGTEFSVGTRAFQGETYNINLPVESRSDEELTVEIRLRQVAGPSDITVRAQETGSDEFDDGSEIRPVVQVSENVFRFKIDPNSVDRVRVQTRIPADADPGFYRVNGTIKISNGLE